MTSIKRTLPYFLSIIIFTSCHISAKMDRFVSQQYNDQIPKVSGKKNQEIAVTTGLPVDQNTISITKKKTSQLLPLIVYWSFDYRRTCSINYKVPLNLITTSLYSTTNKRLEEKIQGKKLEIHIEQMPHTFAIVDKAHFALLIYWSKLYREPDFTDLVVSYKLLENDNILKSGRLTIENKLQNVGVRFAQSIRSSCEEAISEYNQELSGMSKRLLDKLTDEL